jgi:hypothetical protein
MTVAPGGIPLRRAARSCTRAIAFTRSTVNQGQRPVLQTPTEDVREPRPVPVEDADYRAAHRFGRRSVFRSQHRAHAHAFASEHVRVKVGVGLKRRLAVVIPSSAAMSA